MPIDELVPFRLGRPVDRRRRPAVGAVAAAGLCAALVGMAGAAQAAPESFADMAEKLVSSVVNISTTQVVEGRPGGNAPPMPQAPSIEELFKEFFDKSKPPRRPVQSLGSGFIVDSSGIVVTNNHVIQDADEINVILHDKSRLKAEVVGRDAKTDLAVLRVNPTHKLQAVRFGNSDAARVGDWILAIGNPFGLGGTVTAGIISARGRDINSGPYDDYIQTDASINRGNSGGPMFNTRGEVIGINTAIFSPSGGSVGIGFAIPSLAAEPVIKQLVEFGRVRRGWLGVHIQQVTDEIAESLSLAKARGALVASVTRDSPAEKGKIKAGDVILKFDNRDIDEMRKLPRVVAETVVGKAVDVALWRDGREQTLKVTVGELDERESEMAATSRGGERESGEQDMTALGMTLATVTPRLRERFDLEADAKGVVVTRIDSGSMAASRGVQAGDVIVEVANQEVNSAAEMTQRIDEARKAGRKVITVLLQRQGRLNYVPLRLDGAP